MLYIAAKIGNLLLVKWGEKAELDFVELFNHYL